MMRCFCILIFVVASVIASAQNKTGQPLVTPITQPFGEMASAKIDNKGGKLKSVDGGLEIIVPENAVEFETLISIQSTNNAINENDKGAYLLEPSGINFKKPVQLIFHYNDESESPDLLGIAWQDDSGKWHNIKNFQADTVQKIISCFVPHFSRWSAFSHIYLSPGSATVKVNKTLRLHLVSLEDIRDAANDESLAAGGSDDDLLAAPHDAHYYSGEWTVNGIVNGNSEVGTVSRQDNRNAIYKAPAVIPDANPVAASVQIYSNNSSKKLLLTSNITVVGAQYHFTYAIYSKQGCYYLIDSSSCILNMGKHNFSVSEIKNHKPWSDWPPSCDGCNWEWLNRESLKGLVELSGIASSQITPPANEGGPTNVIINFSPAMGNTPSAKVTCPGSSPVSVPGQSYPAMPANINFDLDGDNVIIHAAGKTGRNVLTIGNDQYKTLIRIYKLNN